MDDGRKPCVVINGRLMSRATGKLCPVTTAEESVVGAVTNAKHVQQNDRKSTSASKNA